MAHQQPMAPVRSRAADEHGRTAPTDRATGGASKRCGAGSQIRAFERIPASRVVELYELQVANAKHSFAVWLRCGSCGSLWEEEGVCHRAKFRQKTALKAGEPPRNKPTFDELGSQPFLCGVADEHWPCLPDRRDGLSQACPVVRSYRGAARGRPRRRLPSDPIWLPRETLLDRRSSLGFWPAQRDDQHLDPPSWRILFHCACRIRGTECARAFARTLDTRPCAALECMTRSLHPQWTRPCPALRRWPSPS